MANDTPQGFYILYLSGPLKYQHLSHKQADPLSEWMRYIVLVQGFHKGQFRCYLCGHPIKSKLDVGGVNYHQRARDYHCEHRIPRKKGGSNDAKNLEACCKDCNMLKSDHPTFDVRLAAWRLGENVGYRDFKSDFQDFLHDEKERFDYLSGLGRADEYIPDEYIPYRHLKKATFPRFPGLRADCTFETTKALQFEQWWKTRNLFEYLSVLQNLQMREYAFECYVMAWGTDAREFMEARRTSLAV